MYRAEYVIIETGFAKRGLIHASNFSTLQRYSKSVKLVHTLNFNQYVATYVQVYMKANFIILQSYASLVAKLDACRYKTPFQIPSQLRMYVYCNRKFHILICHV